MVSAHVKIVNPQGMHMRPAQLFVNTVGQYKSEVTLLFDGKRINAKSIMHLMAACIRQGSEVEVQCCGQEEEEALRAAVGLIRSGLGE